MTLSAEAAAAIRKKIERKTNHEHLILKATRRVERLSSAKLEKLIAQLDTEVKPKGKFTIYPDIFITPHESKETLKYSFDPRKGEYFLDSKQLASDVWVESLDLDTQLTFDRKERILTVSTKKTQITLGNVKYAAGVGNNQIWVFFTDGRQELLDFALARGQSPTLKTVAVAPLEMGEMGQALPLRSRKEKEVAVLVSYSDKFIVINDRQSLFVLLRPQELGMPLILLREMKNIYSQAIAGNLLFFFRRHDLPVMVLPEILALESNELLVTMRNRHVSQNSFISTISEEKIAISDPIDSSISTWNVSPVRVDDAVVINELQTFVSRPIMAVLGGDALISNSNEVFMAKEKQVRGRKKFIFPKADVLPQGSTFLLFPTREYLRKIARELEMPVVLDVREIVIGFCAATIQALSLVASLTF